MMKQQVVKEEPSTIIAETLHCEKTPSNRETEEKKYKAAPRVSISESIQ